MNPISLRNRQIYFCSISPDASAIFHQTLGGYEDSAKNALEAAAKIAVAAWNGQSQIDAREVFDRAYGVASNNRYLREFMIDFHGVWPSADQFMKEGVRLAGLQANGFAENGAKELRMYKREAFLANGGGNTNNGGSQFLVGGEEGVSEIPSETSVLSEQQVEEYIQSTIAERVAARLTERLASMSIEERAEARGLLRLHQQGRLEEYLSGLFSGDTNEELDSELESQGGGYSIYYLLDPVSVKGAGHAAVIMGSESEGWSYFSFGKGATGGEGQTTWQDWITTNGNMDVDYFVSLEDARTDSKMERYKNFLRWDIDSSNSVRSSFAQASTHLSSSYNVFGGNCDDIAKNIIISAGISLDDAWFPSNTVEHSKDVADSYGTWYYKKTPVTNNYSY